MHMRVDANGGFCMVSLDYRRISPIWIISSSKNGMTKQQRSRYIWKTHQHGAWYLVSDVWWSTRTKVQNSMETCNNMMYTTRFATWSWNRLKGVKKEWTQGSWQWTQRCYRQTAIDRDAEPVNITSVTKNGRSLVDGQVGARKNNNSIGMRDTICGSWWRVTSHTAVVFLVTHGKSIPPGRNHGNLPSMKHGGMITQSWVIGATVIQ